MSNHLENMSMEAVVSEFEMLSKRLSGGVAERNENPQLGQQDAPGFTEQVSLVCTKRKASNMLHLLLECTDLEGSGLCVC
jgi:hypothetical protein